MDGFWRLLRSYHPAVSGFSKKPHEPYPSGVCGVKCISAEFCVLGAGMGLLPNLSAGDLLADDP